MHAQAANIATIAGQKDPGCTTTDGTNSNAAPFPGAASALELLTDPTVHVTFQRDLQYCRDSALGSTVTC